MSIGNTGVLYPQPIVRPPYTPRVNPPGQGFNGNDPGFTVPRIGPDGQWQQRAVNDPATKGFNTSDNPASFIDALIRREDFPPGPEGDAAYEAALQTYMNTPAQITTGFDQFGNPIREEVAGGVLPNNRTGTQQNVWDAQQSASLTSQGGSSSLATISWAQNHPQEALSALMAMNPTTMGESGFLDDATIRDIVTGLGGVAAVNQMIAQERSELIELGLIPGPQGGPGAQGVPNMGSGMQIGDAWSTDTGQPPVSGVPQQPGDTFPVDPADYAGIPGVQPAPTGTPGLDVPRPIGDAPQEVQDVYAPDPLQQPYQMGQNGEVVSTQGLPSGYDYTQIGQDVYLDVTDPTTGMVHRFSGDVVEAAYSQHGASSFDELVLTLGYEAAVQALFGYIQPPAMAVGGPGSAGPVNPGNPAPPSNYFPEPAGPPTSGPTNY